MKLDYSKYKRFVVFGCSFTNYYWPTWADILSKEMPSAEYYNFGRCGGGNLFIASRITEANLKLKFNEYDLVMVMWSTLCREDRYFHGNWCLPGNIFTQGVYSDDFVKQFAEPEGYLVRDLSLIKMTTDMMKTTDSTFISLNCQNYDAQQEKDHLNNLKPSTKKILNVYKDFIDSSLPNFYDLEFNGQWENGHEYINEHGYFVDYHPSPIRYFNYLKKLKFNLSEKTHQFALQATSNLIKTKTRSEIENLFKNEPNINHDSVKNICF